MELTENISLEKPLKMNRDKLIEDKAAQNAVKDISIYFVFLIVTTIITLSSKGIGMFYFNDTVERLLIHPAKSPIQFDELVTIEDWWLYVQTTFIENIDYFELRNSPNKLAVGGNCILGVPRLRQIRVQEEPCEVDDIFKNEFKSCHGTYSASNEYTGEFKNMKHFTRKELKTTTIWGSVTHYYGAGYIYLLTLNHTQNSEILLDLEAERWVDSATRLVLLEFTLMNMNANLLCNAKLLAEIPATGGIITSNRLQVLKFSPLWNKGGYFLPFCALVFSGLILYYTFQAMQAIMTQGCYDYYSGSIFKIIDLIIYLIAYFSAAYVFCHILYVKSTSDKYAENEEEYYSLDIICYWNLFFIDGMGICGFLVWIQALKYIRFNRTMMQFSATLQRCSVDILSFSIMFSVILIAYAYVAVLWFGSLDPDFYDLPTAIVTLMRMVLGDIDYQRLEEANRILGPLFFLSFVLFIFFILMNMFLAIINETYAEVKSEPIEKKDNDLGLYVKELVEKLRNHIFSVNKKNRKPVREQTLPEPEPALVTSQPFISPSVEVFAQSTQSESLKPLEHRPRTIQEILDSFFEVVSVDRDLHENGLNRRVTLLEQKMERLIENLDKILDKTASNVSTRSA